MSTPQNRGRRELNRKKSDTRRSENESDDEIMQKIDSLRRDREKFEEWIASRVETVVKHWPKR